MIYYQNLNIRKAEIYGNFRLGRQIHGIARFRELIS
jgi:hypothetical protein